MKQPLNSIDLAKFIASVLVFSMHCNALADFKYAGFLLQVFARWGVPFFFICSSYFLFKKIKNEQLVNGNKDTYIHTYIESSLYIFYGSFIIYQMFFICIYIQKIYLI